jgi:hypothetical protein
VFVAAAVCPQPPLLLPEVAQRATPELDDLRTACTAAVTAMLDAGPDAVVCVGEGRQLHRYDESAGGTLHDYGVDVRAGGASIELPLALTIGAWLLDRAAWRGPRRYVAIPQESTPQECAEMGEKVAAADMRVGVLAMGDGSAKRSTTAPGYLDERAGSFDAEVARALAEPDPAWLTHGLAPLACAELWAAGRPAWQFLAGAATRTPPDAPVAARMLYDAAPFGVGYFVAEWTTAAHRPPD